MKIIYFIIVFSTCLTTNVYAYLDPGTGSILLQMIIGFFAMVATVISIWWTFLKNKIKKIFSKKKTNNLNNSNQ